MHSLYIIYSEKLDRYYTGETPDIHSRLNQHNTHHFKNSFSKNAEDWTVKLVFETIDKKDALYLERFIKKMKSRKFIEKIIKEPSILNEILAKRN